MHLAQQGTWELPSYPRLNRKEICLNRKARKRGRRGRRAIPDVASRSPVAGWEVDDHREVEVVGMRIEWSIKENVHEKLKMVRIKRARYGSVIRVCQIQLCFCRYSPTAVKCLTSRMRSRLDVHIFFLIHWIRIRTWCHTYSSTMRCHFWVVEYLKRQLFTINIIWRLLCSVYETVIPTTSLQPNTLKAFISLNSFSVILINVARKWRNG